MDQNLDAFFDRFFIKICNKFWMAFGSQDGSKIDETSITKQDTKKTKKGGQNVQRVILRSPPGILKEYSLPGSK